jgi:hypothetical protein
MFAQEIVDAFIRFIHNFGGAYYQWYIGIAADPEKKLFNDHMVNKKNDTWKYENAGSEKNALTIEKYLIDKFGAQGDEGSGDSNTTYVYAYRISDTTAE